MGTETREVIELFIDERSVRVAPGASVAAAVMNAGKACRASVTGERRAALCGMGVCFECRVEIDGVLHERSCMIEVSEGMRVRTVDAG
ncbi:MAG: (2Fe-2S)-binding protein [Phycisphaerae bacterium]|nr:(2Fe-2S)-binding protein [Phycisphaerae bacterium]